MMQRHFFTVSIYRDVMVCRIIYNIIACDQNTGQLHERVLRVVRATCQRKRKWRVVQCFAERLAETGAKYRTGVTWHWIHQRHGTE